MAETDEAGATAQKTSQKGLLKRRKELRHRAQSLVEGATDAWEEAEEYETVIPECSEDEFIDEETAEIAEEVIEYTYTIRELFAETFLGQDLVLYNRLQDNDRPFNSSLRYFSVFLYIV